VAALLRRCHARLSDTGFGTLAAAPAASVPKCVLWPSELPFTSGKLANVPLVTTGNWGIEDGALWRPGARILCRPGRGFVAPGNEVFVATGDEVFVATRNGFFVTTRNDGLEARAGLALGTAAPAVAANVDPAPPATVSSGASDYHPRRWPTRTG
jgi:hypothetical protein